MKLPHIPYLDMLKKTYNKYHWGEMSNGQQRLMPHRFIWPIDVADAATIDHNMYLC